MNRQFPYVGCSSVGRYAPVVLLDGSSSAACRGPCDLGLHAIGATCSALGRWGRSGRSTRPNEDEGHKLLQITRRRNHESIRVRRATIIMASAAGTPVPRSPA